MGRKILGLRAAVKQVKQHPTGFIGSTLFSALSLVFKTIPRFLVAQLPIFGPDSAAVKGVLENITAVSGGDEFNVICIKQAVY